MMKGRLDKKIRQLQAKTVHKKNLTYSYSKASNDFEKESRFTKIYLQENP